MMATARSTRETDANKSINKGYHEPKMLSDAKEYMKRCL